jgi:hypothetical protein
MINYIQTPTTQAIQPVISDDSAGSRSFSNVTFWWRPTAAISF